MYAMYVKVDVRQLEGVLYASRKAVKGPQVNALKHIHIYNYIYEMYVFTYTIYHTLLLPM